MKNNRLLTPDLTTSGVWGVMRDHVLKAAHAMGVETVVTPVSLADLNQADEVFVTNSLLGIWPVVVLKTSGTPGVLNTMPVGPMTRCLQAAIVDQCPM